jgi:hypothetical protein
MNRTVKIVSLVAAIAMVGAMLATPVLAAAPETPVTLWQRLQQWFRLQDGDHDAEGVPFLMRWRNGADGEGFGPRQGFGVWNETGAAVRAGQPAVDEMASLTRAAVQQRSEASVQAGPGPNTACQFVDEDGDGVCDLCGELGKGPGPGDGVCDGTCDGGDADGDGLQQQVQSQQTVGQQSGEPQGAQGSENGQNGAGGQGGSRGR